MHGALRSLPERMRGRTGPCFGELTSDIEMDAQFSELGHSMFENPCYEDLGNDQRKTEQIVPLLTWLIR